MSLHHAFRLINLHYTVVTHVNTVVFPFVIATVYECSMSLTLETDSYILTNFNVMKSQLSE